jgi:Co/Zn/Cd efflux system component
VLIVGCTGLGINLIGLFLFHDHGHSHGGGGGGGGGHGHSHGGSAESHGHSHEPNGNVIKESEVDLVRTGLVSLDSNKEIDYFHYLGIE